MRVNFKSLKFLVTLVVFVILEVVSGGSELFLELILGWVDLGSLLKWIQGWVGIVNVYGGAHVDRVKVFWFTVRRQILWVFFLVIDGGDRVLNLGRCAHNIGQLERWGLYIRGRMCIFVLFLNLWIISAGHQIQTQIVGFDRITFLGRGVWVRRRNLICRLVHGRLGRGKREIFAVLVLLVGLWILSLVGLFIWASKPVTLLYRRIILMILQCHCGERMQISPGLNVWQVVRGGRGQLLRLVCVVNRVVKSCGHRVSLRRRWRSLELGQFSTWLLYLNWKNHQIWCI